MDLVDMLNAERQAMRSEWATHGRVRDLQKAVDSLFDGPTAIENRHDRIVVTIWRDGGAALNAAGLVQYIPTIICACR